MAITVAAITIGAAIGPAMAGLMGRVICGAPRGSLVWWPLGTVPVGRIMVVAGLCAAVSGLLAARLGAVTALPAYLYLGISGVVLAVIDIIDRRLPDVLVYPLYLVGVATFTPVALINDEPARLGRTGLVAGVTLVAFYVQAILGPGGLGLGDVKFAGALGLYLGWLGWDRILTGVLVAYAMAAVTATAMLLARRGTRDIPFGPALLVGALAAISLNPGMT